MKGYFTLANAVSGEYEEKKSRFIAKLIPVSTEEEAAQKIAEIKKLNFSARHNVFAYRLANGVERQSDDGEPSGTGGRPLMELIVSADVHDVLVVVTRYFGGVLLGTGGLKRAYSAAAADAFRKAEIIKQSEAVREEIEIPYAFYDRAEILFSKHKALVEDKVFGESVNLTLVIPKENEEDLILALTEILSGDLKISKKEEILYFFKN